MKTTLDVDVIIFGGGIAGLWTLARLCQAGFNAILLENDALGSGQTLKSQGIIHGGLKYALNAKLTAATTNIATLPAYWQRCLQGVSDIDLRSVPILSKQQYFWTAPSFSARMTSFLASFTVASQCTRLVQQDYPAALQAMSYNGDVYALQEIVLDIPTLVQQLSRPWQERILHTANTEVNLHYATKQPQQLHGIDLHNSNHTLHLRAKHYIFTAGQGNVNLLGQQHSHIKMQRRPLHMVILQKADLPPLFAHCIGTQSTPLVTITTHTTAHGQTVWYLGGQLAEQGCQRTASEQIQIAQTTLAKLIPWVDLRAAKWHSFFVDRSEAKQAKQKRPDTFTVQQQENILVAWPTKLTLAPAMADAIVAKLTTQPSMPDADTLQQLANWPTAPCAKPPWDEVF